MKSNLDIASSMGKTKEKTEALSLQVSNLL